MRSVGRYGSTYADEWLEFLSYTITFNLNSHRMALKFPKRDSYWRPSLHRNKCLLENSRPFDTLRLLEKIQKIVFTRQATYPLRMSLSSLVGVEKVEV